jgi:hypothetical protein
VCGDRELAVCGVLAGFRVIDALSLRPSKSAHALEAPAITLNDLQKEDSSCVDLG